MKGSAGRFCVETPSASTSASPSWFSPRSGHRSGTTLGTVDKLDIWQLAHLFRSPMSGEGRALEPGKDVEAVRAKDVLERRDAAQAELVRRGFSEQELEIVAKGGLPSHQLIRYFLASGRPRYGA